MSNRPEDHIPEIMADLILFRSAVALIAAQYVVDTGKETIIIDQDVLSRFIPNRPMGLQISLQPQLDGTLVFDWDVQLGPRKDE